MKVLSALALGTACSISLSFIASAPAAKAAIFSVPDSGSWVPPGTNTLSNLGFNMVEVPNDPSQPEFSFISTLSSPLGNLTFSPEVQKRDVPESWQTWSHGYNEEVYFSGFNVATTTITLPFGIGAFDLYVEPNNFNLFEIAVTAMDGTTTTLSQEVNGFGGAKYFGFYATDEDMLATITVTDQSGGAAGGFAVGELRLAAKAVPEAVPEPASTLGVLAFGVLGAGSLLKRKQEQKA